MKNKENKVDRALEETNHEDIKREPIIEEGFGGGGSGGSGEVPKPSKTKRNIALGIFIAILVGMTILVLVQ